MKTSTSPPSDPAGGPLLLGGAIGVALLLTTVVLSQGRSCSPVDEHEEVTNFPVSPVTPRKRPKPVTEVVPPVARSGEGGLPEPWASMALPVDGGTVESATADALLVIWGDRDVAIVTAAWTTSLSKAGWRREDDRSRPGRTVVHYRRHGAILGLAAGEIGGTSYAWLEDLGSAPSGWLDGGTPPPAIAAIDPQTTAPEHGTTQ